MYSNLKINRSSKPHRTTLETLFMSTRSISVYRSLLLVALALSGQSLLAAEPTQSLAEKRLSIFKGTAPGIVIVDFDKAPRAGASAQRSASTAHGTGDGTGDGAGTATDSKNHDATASEQTSGSRFLSALPPPSGRSLQSARRLDAPDQGIAVPTAHSASQPLAEPPKR